MIFISAGHHAGAQGAKWNGFTEWMEAQQWVHILLTILSNEIVTKVPPGLLRHKVRFINEHARTNDMAVEIHFNSAVVNGTHVGKGCETLYFPGSEHGKALANLIQDKLKEVFPPDRGAKEGWYRMDRPGVVDYDGDVDGDEKIDYFLRKTNCPAVIVEPDFIHRSSRLMMERFRGCSAIARALLEAKRVLGSTGAT